MASVAALAFGLACGGEEPPPAPVPSDASDLDALSFVDGCWSWFHIDYGVSWCWTREPDAWVGAERFGGPMAVPSEGTVRIVVGPDGLEASSSGELWTPPFDHVPVNTQRPGLVRFERGTDALELSAGPTGTTLLLRESTTSAATELTRSPRPPPR